MNSLHPLAVLLLCATASAALGLDLETLDGELYKNVKIRAVEPSGLRITHAKGVSFLRFDNLPEEIRAQYGYDPEQAKIAETKAAEARALQASRKERREGGVWLRITGIEEMSPVELVDPAGIPEDQIKDLCGCYVYGQEVINKQVEIPNSGTVTIRPEGEGQVSPITLKRAVGG